MATPAPDISVVIATCRRPNLVGGTILSALAQAGVSVEVIVVDDCPCDASAQAVAAVADGRVRYLANPVPSGRGPAEARNLGLTLARAEAVHFLDDDDLVPDGHYAATAALLRGTPGIGVVFGTVRVFGDDAAAVAHEADYFRAAARLAGLRARLGPRWGFLATMLFGPTLLVCGAGVVRRRCAEQIGGFDASLAIVEDVEFYSRAIRQAGARFVPRDTLHYRIGPSLMRDAGLDAKLAQSYAVSHARYRREHGRAEFMALKAAQRAMAAVRC